MLEFLGRLDAQVKIRGVRVEPGEVEAALQACPGVDGAAVVVRTDPRRGIHLVAFYSGTVDVNVVRPVLRDRLPESMVPSLIEKVDELPRTASGKIDRGELAARGPVTVVAEASDPPANEIQRRVAQMWSQVLGIPSPGLDDNFFDLGGHSLIITRLSALVREAFGVRVEVRRFLEIPTVRGMADGVVEEQLRHSDPDDVAALLDLLERDARPHEPVGPQTASRHLPAAAGGSASIPSLSAIALPTFQRVPALLRAVESYHDNARRHGHAPSFTVMDNSPTGVVREQYRESLSAFAGRTGADVSYAGMEEKTTWLDDCAGSRASTDESSRSDCSGTAGDRSTRRTTLTPTSCTRRADLSSAPMTTPRPICDFLRTTRHECGWHLATPRSTGPSTTCPAWTRP